MGAVSIQIPSSLIKIYNTCIVRTRVFSPSPVLSWPVPIMRVASIEQQMRRNNTRWTSILVKNRSRNFDPGYTPLEQFRGVVPKSDQLSLALLKSWWAPNNRASDILVARHDRHPRTKCVSIFDFDRKLLHLGHKNSNSNLKAKVQALFIAKTKHDVGYYCRNGGGSAAARGA